jgi:hypothetical protein
MRLNIVHYLVTLKYFISAYQSVQAALKPPIRTSRYQVLKIENLTWPRVKLCDGARESSEAQDGAV